MSVHLRELPREDWGRLLDTESGLNQVLPYLPENGTSIYVVENEQGEIVATQALVTLPHLEGLWIRQDYRSGTIVQRKLLTCILKLMKGLTGVWTGAESSQSPVAALLLKLGGIPLPFASYYLPLTGVESLTKETVDVDIQP